MMLLGTMTLLSVLSAAAIGWASGAYGSWQWLWVLPVSFVGTWLGLFLLAFLFLTWKAYRHRKEIVLAERKVLCKLLGIVACYPFLWYAVLTNHSYMHDWFTYRELAITVFAVSMLYSVISSKKKMREEGWHG